jgi:2-C-methyl-D-erythritol 4-phosphate cytidylyltransferase
MVSVIIPAAGVGTRFGGEIPKQFLPLANGFTVLEHTVSVFESIDWINEIIITVPADFNQKKRCGHNIKTGNAVHIEEGGASRSESIYKALHRLSGKTEIVLIHDGVRPLVSPGLIKAVADAARLHGAAAAGTVFTDTVKECKPPKALHMKRF